MSAGVMFILAAIAFVLRSRPHGAWALTFAVINATYIPLLEEPLLEARFGDEYREYCRHVRRFIPRLTPWSPPGA
jgi:protein-S-isoprenylcysteine O-methyltransferase Ste14